MSAAWVQKSNVGTAWTAPSGRIYSTLVAKGTVIAFCDGRAVQTNAGSRGSRIAWWRSPPAAQRRCEEMEARRANEERQAQPVQTSAPKAPAKILTPVEEAEERFTFRVGQALRCKDVGAHDVARKWLTDAISALDDLQRIEWAKRDQAARAKS